MYTVPVFFLYMLFHVFFANITCLQYHCIWSHYNGDCPGQVVRAMPQPFVPYDDIGNPDLSVIPPPVVDRCCCCVIILPHGGNKFVFISFQCFPDIPILHVISKRLDLQKPDWTHSEDFLKKIISFFWGKIYLAFLEAEISLVEGVYLLIS